MKKYYRSIFTSILFVPFFLQGAHAADFCGIDASPQASGDGFVGTWEGYWDNELCSVILVRPGDGSHDVLYIRGENTSWNIYDPKSYELTGSVSGNKLTVEFPSGSEAVYVLDGDKLDGTFHSSRGSVASGTFKKAN